jgi:aminoglycoside/choline kinase family phosphotransferase
LKFGEKPLSADQLPKSGSDRVYYRLKNEEYSAIGAFNSDINENEAFFSFTNTFSEIGINVPDILAISPDRKHYLISDLGNETLFDIIRRNDQGKAILCRIRDILMDLLKIQNWIQED